MERHLTTEQKEALRTAAAEHGLYRHAYEHDACGMGFVAHLKGEKSHSIIADALTVLDNMSHRGACGCDPETGDGAGIMTQIPHELYKELCAEQGFTLPEPGRYAVGMLFLPLDGEKKHKAKALIERILAEDRQPLLGFRPVKVNPEAC
ncbi:MAG TPA: hypothetical protein VF331_16060, partial [Polyangiales bacterium]